MLREKSHLQSAHEYAKLGYPVLPLVPGKKVPLCAHGLKEASCNPARIAAWWRKWPTANIGLRTDCLVVLDIDPGGRLPEDLRQAIRELRPPIQKTPRGYHVFLRLPEGKAWKPSVSKIAAGVDIRVGPGSYVVVSPSIVDGHMYTFLRPLRPPEEIPFPPPELAQLLDARKLPQPRLGIRIPPPATRPLLETGPIYEGTRNDTLFRLGCRLRYLGYRDAEIEHELLRVNGTCCVPPLPHREVLAIVRSVCRYPLGLSPLCVPQRTRMAQNDIRLHRYV